MDSLRKLRQAFGWVGLGSGRAPQQLRIGPETLSAMMANAPRATRTAIQRDMGSLTGDAVGISGTWSASDRESRFLGRRPQNGKTYLHSLFTDLVFGWLQEFEKARDRRGLK